MRKLAILAIVAAPISALGAYAFAANDDTASPESRMVVNESQKSDLATTEQTSRLFAMGESEEDETEAGPIRPDGLIFDDDGDHEGDHDDDD